MENTRPNKKKKLKKRLVILGILLVVTVLLFMWGFSLKTETYKIKSDKIDKGLKIVFISDLHNCFFGGTDQSGLKKEIDKAEPDIVIFGGDVIDMVGGQKYALELMKWSAERYPCFYTPGNHEDMRDDTDEFMEKVKKSGVEICHEKYSDIEVRGQAVRIYG